MREIKFRGWNPKNKCWLHGFYLMNRGAHFVCPDEFAHGKSWDDYEILPETLGQFTGLRDEFEKEVFDGDIIILDGAPEFGKRVIVYYEEAFNIATRKEYDSLMAGAHPYLNDYAHMTCLNEWSNSGLVRVIGNIHDNPELLEQREQCELAQTLPSRDKSQQS